MTADKVRVAVVGTGHWAQVAHIPGWLRDPRAEVVALADVNETALAEAAGAVPGARVTRRARPDGAVHTGLTEAALRRLTEGELELQ